ncbi:MAG: DUF4062 domain-containing protein [Saccharofermentanales bacterium]|jgi:hypothetical protein
MCIWHEDADNFRRGDSALDIVFRNNIVNSYLNSTKKLGIAATKGQGKTFLIKAKRNMLQNTKDCEDDTESVVCFPKDSTMVDTLNKTIKPMIFNSRNKSLFDRYQNWVTLWLFSIIATIVCSEEFRHLYRAQDFKSFSDDVLFMLNIRINDNGQVIYKSNYDNSNNKPSTVFTVLIQQDRETLLKVINETCNVILLLSRINSGVYFFIDKVDQAFSEDVYDVYAFNASKNSAKRAVNASYWQFCQYALADAAYQIYLQNSHIKVFYTIRLEAILDSHKLVGNTTRNIESFLVELSYSKNDLFKMFCLYVENESDNCLAEHSLKKSNHEKAMFGFNEIKHSTISDVVEGTFDYIYRHSLRRPCDIMFICKYIYLANPKDLTLNIFRRTVNDSARRMLEMYLIEVEPFMTLDNNTINLLLKMLNTNIFDSSYMRLVCERFNTEYGNISSCNKDCEFCQYTHPFSALQNIGLLGYLRKSEDNLVARQQFLPIGESKLKLNEHDLQNSRLFMLHPCLRDKTKNARRQINKAFSTCKYTIVGEGVELEENTIINIEESLHELKEQLNDDKVFVSSTIEDLINEREATKLALIKKHLYPIMSEQPNFRYGYNDVDSHDHCIDEMLKCKGLIYIIGSKYGGDYSGDKYVEFANKIVELSGGRIQRPSISLMEFFVARANNMPYHIFVSEEVIREKQEQKSGNNHSIVCDERVFHIINFVNHLKDGNRRKGNWFLTYRDADHLSQMVVQTSSTVLTEKK